jgi:hypothetical protein
MRRDQRPVQRRGDWVFRLAAGLSAALSGLGLLFLAGLAWTVSYSMNVRAPQVPAYMPGLLTIPLLALPLTLLVLALTVLAWRARSGTVLSRIRHSLVALSGLAFVWFTWYWNLLGFKL